MIECLPGTGSHWLDPHYLFLSQTDVTLDQLSGFLVDRKQLR